MHQLELVQHPARSQAFAVPEDGATAHGDPLPLGELLEQRRPRSVDEPDPAPEERQWPAVRVLAARRRRDVDNDSHARLDELLGRDAIQIDVVDDRDVVSAQPPHEMLRAPIEPRPAGQLDRFACTPLRTLGSGSCSHLVLSIRSRRRQPSKGTRGRRAYARSPPAARPHRARGYAYALDRRAPSPR